MEERNRCFWLGLGASSGWFLGALLLLVWTSYWKWARSDDGMLLEMALGSFGAGPELLFFALSRVTITCPFTIYVLMFPGA